MNPEHRHTWIKSWRSTQATIAVGMFLWWGQAPVSANPPVASYIFPAGGQRGQMVTVRVGGLHLYKQCWWEMTGPGITVSPMLTSIPTIWFEGPVLPLTESQKAENYPADMAGTVTLTKDAALGRHSWRLWTGQGAASGWRFEVGELPEIVETEIAGPPVAVPIELPRTVNGRIFPREDIDEWAFSLDAHKTVVAHLRANVLGSPLDARLQLLDDTGRVLAENDDAGTLDPCLCYTTAQSGTYRLRVSDIANDGSQAHVYRLTVTQGPHVDSYFPLGGQRGKLLELRLHGVNLSKSTTNVQLPTDPSVDVPWSWAVPLQDNHHTLLPLDLDDYPEKVEKKDQAASLDAPKLPTLPNTKKFEVFSAPVVFNGRVEFAGNRDSWPLQARKGEILEFCWRGPLLGSPLLGVVTVSDGTGAVFTKFDFWEAKTLVPRFTWTVPSDGIFQVTISDRFARRGGQAFAYRLRIAPPQTGFRATMLTDVLSVARGGQAHLKLKIERWGGFAQPIVLSCRDLPAGVSCPAVTVNPGQNDVTLVFKAEKLAPIKVGRVAVDATPILAPGQKSLPEESILATKRAVTFVDNSDHPVSERVLVTIAAPTPFKIVGKYEMRWASRGTTSRRLYQIERGTYQGPIEVRLAQKQARHLQGVTGPTLIIPPGENQFEYPLILPPWLETGRTCRVCVMGVGTLDEVDGRRLEVSYSSTEQNDQFIAVIEPGRLGLEATPKVVSALPGNLVRVQLHLARGKNVQGPATIAIVPVPGLLLSGTARFSADQVQGELMIAIPNNYRFAEIPILLRATVMTPTGAVVAETSIEIVRTLSVDDIQPKPGPSSAAPR